MSVQQHIALTQRRRCLGIEDMSVRDIHQPLPCRQYGIVREDREREYHLVHLGVAVAAHAEDCICHAVQHGNHLLRRIIARQIVSRSVVKNIAEQQQTRSLFALERREELLTVVRRAVNIGCNEKFHAVLTFPPAWAHPRSCRRRQLHRRRTAPPPDRSLRLFAAHQTPA